MYFEQWTKSQLQLLTSWNDIWYEFNCFKHKCSLYPVSDCKRVDKCHMWLATNTWMKREKKTKFYSVKLIHAWDVCARAAGGDSLWMLPNWRKICMKFIYKIHSCASTMYKLTLFWNRMEFRAKNSHLLGNMKKKKNKSQIKK